MEIDLSGMWFIEPYLVAFGLGIFAYLLSGPRGFARPPPIRHTALEYWTAGRYKNSTVEEGLVYAVSNTSARIVIYIEFV
jgi:hypothetical protein